MKKNAYQLGLSIMLISAGYGETFVLDNQWEPKTSFPSSNETTLLFTTNKKVINPSSANKGIIYSLNSKNTINGKGWLNLIFDLNLSGNLNSAYIQNNGNQNWGNRHSLTFARKLKVTLNEGSSLYSGIFAAIGSYTHLLFFDDLILDSSKAKSKQQIFGTNPKLALFARGGGSLYVNAEETQQGTIRNNNMLVQINGDIGIGGGGNAYINLKNKDSYINGKVFNDNILVLRIYSTIKATPELFLRGGRTELVLENTNAKFDKVFFSGGSLTLDVKNSDFIFKINQNKNNGRGQINRANITNSHLDGHFIMQTNAKLNFNNSTFKGYVSGGGGKLVSLELKNSDWIVTNNSYANNIQVTTTKEEPIQLLYNEDGSKRTQGGRIFSTQELWSNRSLKFSIIVNPQGKSDKIEITKRGSFHTHLLEFHIAPDTSTTITQRLAVATTPNPTLSFEALPTIGGLAVYQPILEREANGDWVVKSFEKIDETTKIALATLNTLPFAQLKFYTNSLNKRLGDLKEYRYDDGVWARTSYAQQSAQRYSNLTPYKNQHFLFQGGYDHAFRLSVGQNFLGAAFEYGHSWVKGGFFNGDGDTIGFVLYNTFVTHQRFYIDTLFKYLYSTHLLNIDAPFNNTQRLNSHFVYGSAEIGYKFIFQHLFFLQPLIEAGIGYIPQHTLGLEDNLHWHYKLASQSSSPLFLQTGVFAGVELKGAIKGDVRFGTFFEYDNNLGTNLILSDVNTKIPYKDLQNYRLAIEFGTNLHLNKNFRLYLSTKSSFFGYINTDYEINLGLRYMFGKYYKPSKKIQPTKTPSKISPTIQNPEPMQEELDSPSKKPKSKNAFDERMDYLKRTSNWINIQQNQQRWNGRYEY